MGLVTFGTPHEGAYLLNSVRNNDHADFIAEACDAIIGGPTEKLEGFLIKLFNIDEKIEDVVNTICQDFAVTAVEQFLDDYLTPITDDYYEGATPITTLNTYSHPCINKVAFYSEEDEPVFWRLVYSLNNPPNSFSAFEAD